MVDTKKRELLAELLEAFISCELTNDEFVDRTSEACPPGRQSRRLQDRALGAVLEMAWFTYDDFETHRLDGKHALTPEGLDQVKRWILFLRTPLEYEWHVDEFISPGGCLLNLLTLGLWGHFASHFRLRRLRSLPNHQYWPFIRESDYQRALSEAALASAVIPAEPRS